MRISSSTTTPNRGSLLVDDAPVSRSGRTPGQSVFAETGGKSGGCHRRRRIRCDDEYPKRVFSAQVEGLPIVVGRSDRTATVRVSGRLFHNWPGISAKMY